MISSDELRFSEVYVKLAPGTPFKVAVTSVELAFLVPASGIIVESFRQHDSTLRHIMTYLLMVSLFAFIKMLDALVNNAYVVATSKGIYINKYGKNIFLPWESIVNVQLRNSKDEVNSSEGGLLILGLRDNTVLSTDISHWSPKSNFPIFLRVAQEEILKSANAG